MKKSNLELLVGGSILVALVIMIAGVLWLKEISLTRQMVQYHILFPSIGSLQVGDPVLVNGVRMGTVKSESLKGTRVLVVINLDKSVPVTDSSVITAQNIGLMGERTVGIQLSERGAVVKPSDKKGKNITYLNGRFDSGIAEAVGLVGTVLGDVQLMVKNVDGILDSTVGDTAFVTFFRHTISRLDTVTRVVERLVKGNQDEINQSLAHVRSITAELDKLVKENEGNVNTIVANGTQLTERGLRITADVESVTVTLRKMLGEIDRGEGSLGAMMHDKQFYEDLKVTVANLDTLVNDIQDRGLKLRIKLGFKEDRKTARP